MASKWLAAFRETEDAPLPVSQSCAVSAVSADSTLPPSQTRPNGTNDTIGTPEQKPERPGSNAEYPTVGDDLDEQAALVKCGANVPRRWAEGYAALCSMAPPSGFSPERWQRIVDAAGAFLDRWASEAITCGWSDLDVFGCDRDRPDARFDCMGLLLLLDRGDIIGIDESGADLVIGGKPQRYRRRPLPASAISLWELAWRSTARLDATSSRERPL